MNSSNDIYKQELRKLRQRIYYRTKQGYNIDIEKLLQGRGTSEQDIEYMRSLRGVNLLSYADYESDDVSDYDTFTNEPQFEEPIDTIDPRTYTHIEQIESIILEFPTTLTIQFDLGQWGEDLYGKRQEVSVEFIGDSLYEIWMRNVNKARQENREIQLDDYYASVEDRLGELLEPYSSDGRYYYESELNSDFTEMLTLLNWGEALSMSEMEGLSDLYSSTDIELNFNPKD